jgi:hypothetical protein
MIDRQDNGAFREGKHALRSSPDFSDMLAPKTDFDYSVVNWTEFASRTSKVSP